MRCLPRIYHAAARDGNPPAANLTSHAAVGDSGGRLTSGGPPRILMDD
jgi:hypothetical protein